MNNFKKFVFYLKNSDRNIVMTDKNCGQTKEELIETLTNVLNTDNISKFETDTDILLIRSKDIMGIQLTNVSYDVKNEETTDIEEEMRVVPEIDFEDITGDITNEIPDIEDDEFEEEFEEELEGTEDINEEVIPEEIENKEKEDSTEIIDLPEEGQTEEIVKSEDGEKN